MRMQRNSSSFGRRDDETEDRKEIYLSILFFSNFSPRWCSKNYTQDTTTLDSRNSRRRESKSCPRLISRGGVSPRGVVLFNAFFFFFRCEELRKFFFLFEAWSLVALLWRRRGGFQMAKREGSRIFHQNFECFRRSSVLYWRGGGAASLFSFFVKRVFNVCLFSGARAYRLFIWK